MNSPPASMHAKPGAQVDYGAPEREIGQHSGYLGLASFNSGLEASDHPHIDRREVCLVMFSDACHISTWELHINASI